MTEPARADPASPRRDVVALVNARSGGSASTDEYGALLAELGVEVRTIEPDAFEEALRELVDEGTGVIAVLGGDGTVRAAACVLAGTGSALLPLPGGTWNHFAKIVGTADVDSARAAIVAGHDLEVPLGEVNGELFCNTAAVGWYPDMVRTRERLRARMPRALAAVAALAVHLPRLHRFDATLDGVTHRAWLVWAGNGRFGLDLAGLAERTALTEGVLDVRVALADRRGARLRLLLDLLRGRLDESDHLERFVTAEPVTVRLRARSMSLAVDAEVRRVAPPLRLVPAAARVRVRTALPA